MSYTPSYDNLTRNVQSLEMGDEIQQVAQVIINYGTDSNGATLYAKHPLTPTITGRTLELTVNTITDYSTAQTIAQNIYGKYHRDTGDDVHEALTITGTELSPLMELGDGVAVNYTNYSDIGNLTVDFSKAMYTDVESQGIPEDDDFPYLSNIADSTTRSFARAKASLQITATEIKATVSGWTGIEEWDEDTTYDTGDTCYLGGVYYKSLIDNNTTKPSATSANWEVYDEATYVTSEVSQTASQIRSEVSAWTGVSAWDSTHTYAKGDFSYYNGKCYVSLVANNLNHLPTNTNYWSETTEKSYVSSTITQSIEGISLEYKSVSSASEYSSSTIYVKGALVKVTSGSTVTYYEALQETQGHTPPSASYWKEVSNENASYVKINSSGVQIGGATITMSNVVADSVKAENVEAGTLDSDVVYSGYISANKISAGKIDARSVGVRGMLSIVASDGTDDHNAGSVGGIYNNGLSYTYLQSSGGNVSIVLFENSVADIASITADLFQIQSGIVLSSSAYGSSRTSVSNPQTGQLFFEV